METFSALLALCVGNSPVTGEFPAQRPVTWSFDVFFDLCLNKRLSKQLWGWWSEMPLCPLWRHCNVIPMASEIYPCLRKSGQWKMSQGLGLQVAHHQPFPANMPECASTESELKRCCQHRFNSDSVPAHSDMFIGFLASGAHFTDFFSIAIAIWWKFCFTLTVKPLI